MAKRNANVGDASLRPPPTLDMFLRVLEQYQHKRTHPVALIPDPIHGTIFQVNPPKKASGSISSERSAVQSALNFFALCRHMNATYVSVDAWFVAWGGLGHSPKFFV